MVSVVRKGRPAASHRDYWTLWLRLFLALGWLLLIATISFVTKPRRPASEPPMWKMVVWLILFAALLRASMVLFNGG